MPVLHPLRTRFKSVLGRQWYRGLIVASVLTIFVISCGAESEATPPPPTPTGPPTLELPISEVPTPVAADALSPEARALMIAFILKQEEITQDWEAFHQAYESWRQQPSNCSEGAMEQSLRDFAAQFQAIATDAFALKRSPSVKVAGDLLAEAAEKEVAGLVTLRDGWSPADNSAFQLFEEARAEANALRRQAADELERLKGPVAEPEVEEFESAYTSVNEDWDLFRANYDSWRQRNGDCNTGEVLDTLNSFIKDFGSIAERVFDLSRPEPIRPLVELLIQAAEKEQLALRELRDTWRPYDISFFQNFDRLRLEADRLRRQVAPRIDDLKFKYQISPEEFIP